MIKNLNRYMVRSADPEEVWLRAQTPAFRLAYRRAFGRNRRRIKPFFARRTNTLMRALETEAITPLKPGEKMH